MNTPVSSSQVHLGLPRLPEDRHLLGPLLHLRVHHEEEPVASVLLKSKSSWTGSLAVVILLLPHASEGEGQDAQRAHGEHGVLLHLRQLVLAVAAVLQAHHAASDDDNDDL